MIEHYWPRYWVWMALFCFVLFSIRKIQMFIFSLWKGYGECVTDSHQACNNRNDVYKCNITWCFMPSAHCTVLGALDAFCYCWICLFSVIRSFCLIFFSLLIFVPGHFRSVWQWNKWMMKWSVKHKQPASSGSSHQAFMSMFHQNHQHLNINIKHALH